MNQIVSAEHQAWLEGRKQGIGGSDVAAILGLSKYKSPYELNQIGDDIAALNLGEPAKTEIGDAFKEKRKALKQAAQAVPDESINAINSELEQSTTVDDLAMLWESRVAPLTGRMTEQHLDLLSATYERKEAELSE